MVGETAGETVANVEGDGFSALGTVFLETEEKIIRLKPTAITSVQKTVLEEIYYVV